MSPVADGNTADIYTLIVHLFNFLQHHAGIDDHAVAQYADLPMVQNPGRQQPQLVGNIVHYNRMTCIGTAAVTHYRICLLGQIVYDFSFSFIAPLGADYHN